MKKIFFSYSLKNKSISVNDLKKLKLNLLLLDEFNIYIDILDNFFNNNCSTTPIEINNDNINSYHQQFLKNNLIESDLVCIINNSSSKNSFWVKQEIILAEKQNIPILNIPENYFFDFIQLTEKKDIRNSNLIKLLK